MLSFRQVYIWGYSRQSTNFGTCFFFCICYLCDLQILNNCKWWFLVIFSIDCFFIWTLSIVTINALLVFNNTWHLSALAFISLSLNHWKITQATSSKSLTTEEILSPVTYGVLSSVKLARSDFPIMKKRSNKWITQTLSFAINKECGRQSNVFDRLVNNNPKAFPWSTLGFHFSISASKQCLALCSFLNPHWYFERISSKNVENCLHKHLSKNFDKFGKILNGR